MTSGNMLVDAHENDYQWHHSSAPVCLFCDSTGYVRSVREWVDAAREANYTNYTPDAWKNALIECHKILIEGRTQCPACQ